VRTSQARPDPGRPVRCLHVVVPEPPDSVGGADMHVRDLAAAQLRLGATDPTVFETLSPPFAARVREAGVACVSVAGRRGLAVLNALRRVILDRRIDVVHAHGYDGTWWAVAARASVRRRPALVVTCHGWIETSRRLRLMSVADRAATRLAAGVIVVSDELVAPALELAGRATAFAVVPNGVPIVPLQDGTGIRDRLGIPRDAVLVGAMGRLSPEKRHDRFLGACALVATRRRDVHFVLAGGGPLRAALIRQARALGLSGRLHLTGVVDRPQALLRELDVVVQPSDAETTSRVVLEAMVQARPVVATRVGGTERLIRHEVDGLVVEAGSPEPVAAQVLRVLGDPVLAARLGGTARRTAVREFDVVDMAAGVDDVYAAVLGREPARPQTWVRRRSTGSRAR
jgi:glycosyltransferase involved in cell wall biosynthesis